LGRKRCESRELGYLRDPRFFWKEFEQLYGKVLSPANKKRISDHNFRSPVVDEVWIQFHPEHAAYKGDVLEHHHVGQGSRAVPLPSRLHDAGTVFHPDRKVVGTPTGGTRPIPPLPPREKAQAEIDRHVNEGRIKGSGIAPERSPKAPEIPPASPLAGLPATPKSPVTSEIAVPASEVRSATRPMLGSKVRPQLRNIAHGMGHGLATLAIALLGVGCKAKSMRWHSPKTWSELARTSIVTSNR